MNNNNYDNWKLTNPALDGDFEVYSSQIETYYHSDEKILSEFEQKVAELAQEYGLYENEEEAYS